MKQFNTKIFNNKKILNQKNAKTAMLSSSALLLAACDLGLDEKGGFVRGTDGNDVLLGSSAYDIFIGSAGADKMGSLGGSGDDVDYANSPSAIHVDLTNNIIKGGFAEGDTLININGITGTKFNDVIIGNESNNSIKGLAGADIIDGKGGEDDIDYTDSENAVQVNLFTGIGKGGDAEGDQLSNIENIRGSFKDDILIGDANDNTIYGTGGEDLIRGGDGNDVIFVEGSSSAYGENGNDQLFGSSGSTLYGGNGDDFFKGGLNRELISGDMGKDSIHYLGVEKVGFEIFRSENKIMITQTFKTNTTIYKDLVNSIESISYSQGEITKSIDIKNIWDDLSAADHAEFNNNEAEFLAWLGDDAGYNYEGL